jgi:tetratricopeptide (TPR) repeat protein
MSKSFLRSRLITLLAYGIAGFSAGICLALVGVEIILAARVNRIQSSLSLVTPVATAGTVSTSPSPTATPSPAPSSTPYPIRHLPTPTRAIRVLIDQADEFIDNGQPEQVKVLLLPHLKDFQSKEDLASIYERLGQAELGQGHFQLAAVYYERLYFNQPSVQNLYTLAICYDAGGNLESALAKYQLLVKLEDTDVEEYREFAEERIKDLSKVLGTPAP